MTNHSTRPTYIVYDEDGPLAITDVSAREADPSADQTEGLEAATVATASDADTPAAPDEIEAAADAPAEVGDDDLLGELARAMRAVATSQYQPMNAKLDRRRTEQVEAIAARASSEAHDLKVASEADISAIDAWAEDETDKIKLEHIRRIDSRREQFARQLERHEAIRERVVVAVEVAIDGHRNDVEQLFGRMEREADPAAIAQIASTLPALPPLAEIAEAARNGAAAEFTNLDEQAALAPVAAIPPRLIGVMDPTPTNDGNGAVSVPMAAQLAGETAAPEPPARRGGTLLGTVQATRPTAVLSDPDSPTKQADKPARSGWFRRP